MGNWLGVFLPLPIGKVPRGSVMRFCVFAHKNEVLTELAFPYPMSQKVPGVVTWWDMCRLQSDNKV